MALTALGMAWLLLSCGPPQGGAPTADAAEGGGIDVGSKDTGDTADALGTPSADVDGTPNGAGDTADAPAAPDASSTGCSGPGRAGQPCTINNTSCGVGICVGDACVVNTKGQACGSAIKPCEVNQCNGSGQCVAVGLPVGSTCTSTAPQPCQKTAGSCTALGLCAFEIDAGAPCPLANAGLCQKPGFGKCSTLGVCEPIADVGAACSVVPGFCGVGVCSSDAKCVVNTAGKPCPDILDTCTVGICSAGKTCVPVPAPAGAACTVPYPAACQSSNGTCNANGLCIAGILAGAKCTTGYGQCEKGTCSAQGTCVLEPPGKPCTQGVPQCHVGTCGEGGVCQPSLAPAGTACTGNLPLCHVGKCSATGECKAIFAPAGTPCTEFSWGKCKKSQGTCSGTGTCEVAVDTGAACNINATTCGAGTCGADGSCQLSGVGKPCGLEVGPCETAVCSAQGVCAAQAKPVGSACTVAKPGACEQASGICASGGSCKPQVALGAACTPPQQPCHVGTCTADGSCAAGAPVPAGTACGKNGGCGVPICDGNGSCIGAPAYVGKSCTGDSSIPCGKSTCNAAGQCEWQPDPGKACFAKADSAASACSSENQCHTGVCGPGVGECLPVATPGKKCQATSPCSTAVCNAAGSCGQIPVADGTACASSGGDPACNTGVCKAGTCTAVPLVGKACGGGLCTNGVCDASGICQQIVAAGKPCGAVSECKAALCSAAGKCEEVVKAGQTCGKASPCSASVCSASGECVPVALAGKACTTALGCDNGVCSAAGACVDPAAPGPPACVVEQNPFLGECWKGELDSAGLCQKVAKVGATCGCTASPCSRGVCQADGSCLIKPSKPAGTACAGPCVTDGVCTADGKCAGKTAVGATCSPFAKMKGYAALHGACSKFVCQADGNCLATPKAAGSLCGFNGITELPLDCGGGLQCDGLGRCVGKLASAEGKLCGNSDGCAGSAQCQGGQCLPIAPAPDGKSCKFGCFTGVCTAGVCGEPGTFNAEVCDDGKICTADTCCAFGMPVGSPGKSYYGQCVGQPTGKCDHNITEWTCSDDGCWVSMCDFTTGQCAGLKVVQGKPCGTDACGQAFVCSKWNYGCTSTAYGTGGQTDPNYSAPCNDGNPCTIDACSQCGCTHEPVQEEVDCAPGGHCSKGNCVPD